MYAIIGPVPSAMLLANHWRPGISKSHTAASFVRPTRPADKPQSFIGALHEKYASDGDGVDPDAGVVIFGTKVAQEMGFDKIRRKLAQVEDLTVVILDGLRVARARDDTEPAIADRCPSITQLDLGRNLFESFAAVVEICGELQNLRSLRLR
jgi:tubulin-specific chaperone E